MKKEYIGEGYNFRYYLINTPIKKFCKQSKTSKSLKKLEEEYKNLKYLQNKKYGKIRFPELIEYNRDKGLITKYINGINLKECLDENVFFSFGEELKKMHNSKLTHGELEVQDVIFTNNLFYLVDLAEINKRKPIEDYISFRISILLYQLKNPLMWRKYTKLLKAFKEGYSQNKNISEQLNNAITEIIKRYLTGNMLDKIKAIIMLIFIKPRVKENE